MYPPVIIISLSASVSFSLTSSDTYHLHVFPHDVIFLAVSIVYRMIFFLLLPPNFEGALSPLAVTKWPEYMCIEIKLLMIV